MTQYTAIPIFNGTRLRSDHNTFAAQIISFAANTPLEADEVWTAPADGNEVKAGDKWIHVVKADGAAVTPGWTAVIHKGLPICKEFTEIPDPVPDPDPQPQPNFPEWFVLEQPDGSRAQFAFVKVL